MDTYKINIEGLDRELRKFPVNDKFDIAAFIMFGDIEMTEVAAKRTPQACSRTRCCCDCRSKGYSALL